MVIVIFPEPFSSLIVSFKPTYERKSYFRKISEKWHHLIKNWENNGNGRYESTKIYEGYEEELDGTFFIGNYI